MRHPDMLARRGVRVGVSLAVRDDQQSIWENGAVQNVVFLVRLLALSPLVERAVVLLNREDDKPLPPGLMLHETGLSVMTLAQAMHELDVVIELSALLDEAWLLQFQQRGGRNIWMRVGNDYVIDIERAMFDLTPGSLCSRKHVAAVWTLPQYEHICGDYFALTTRAPVRTVPHLWSAEFLERAAAQLPEHTPFGYLPGRERWRVLVAEPNLSMVKTCLVPLLAAEAWYREHPRQVEVVRVMNADKLRAHVPFVQMAQMLDLVRHEAVSFDGRMPLVELLAREGDVLVSHQWENSQNYLYYEALYGDYPLIHNSPQLGRMGYYYPDFDCEAGAVALHGAFEHHDEALPDYRRQARAFLKTLGVAYEPNVRAYTEALREVLATPLP